MMSDMDVDAEALPLEAQVSGATWGVIQATVNSITCHWSVNAVPLPKRAGDDVLSGGDRDLRVHIEVVLRGTGADRNGEAHAERRDIVSKLPMFRVDSLSLASPSRVEFVSEFHFVPRGQPFKLTMEVEGCNEAIPEKRVVTASVGQGLPRQLQSVLPDEFWRMYIGPEHTLGEWLGESPEEMMLAFNPSYPLLREFWWNACFTLLSPDSPICQCPNPKSRYCLDLTRSEHWLRGKKVKRHKDDFYLTVNHDYKSSFWRCRDLHSDRGSGCWITAPLVDALDRCRQEDVGPKIYSIELWEKSSGKLAAVIMGLGVGDIFHDYSMATIIRDNRSVGAILSKVVGHLLRECGYTLWYWGFKNAYMAEYDSSYGGVSMDNKTEFWPRWKAARQMQTPPDLAKRVPVGTSIDLAAL